MEFAILAPMPLYAPDNYSGTVGSIVRLLTLVIFVYAFISCAIFDVIKSGESQHPTIISNSKVVFFRRFEISYNFIVIFFCEVTWELVDQGMNPEFMFAIQCWMFHLCAMQYMKASAREDTSCRYTTMDVLWVVLHYSLLIYTGILIKQWSLLSLLHGMFVLIYYMYNIASFDKQEHTISTFKSAFDDPEQPLLDESN